MSPTTSGPDDLMSDLDLTAELFAQRDGKIGIGARLLGLARLSGNFPADDLAMLVLCTGGIYDSRMKGVQALILNGNLANANSISRLMSS